MHIAQTKGEYGLMNKTLIQRADDQVALWDLIKESEGEITPTIQDWLDEVETALSSKVDSYNNFLEALNAEAESLRAKSQGFAAAARSIERIADFLKDRIKLTMVKLGTNEIKGNDYRFKLAKGSDKLVINDSEIPESFKMQITQLIPDKERIKNALLTGEHVSGAKLDPVYSLRSYIVKGN